jgi:hypothetical protein
MSCGTRVQRDVYPGTARGVILEISLKSVIKKKKSIRLKKVHGFYTVFSLFRTENCGLFCVFSTVSFPPRQDTLKL